MAGKNKEIYQVKITLVGSKPSIWRRIQIPSTCTFWELHVAIQDSMGWSDCHLHQFSMENPRLFDYETIGIPSDDCVPGWKKKIADYIHVPKQALRYTYDFGDNWEHKVVLEKVLPVDPNQKYPLCLAGKRACPPEDCGGVWGYEELLDIIKDPNHEDYEERKEWMGDHFDPDSFHPDSVHFSDPKKRLKEKIW